MQSEQLIKKLNSSNALVRKFTFGELLRLSVTDASLRPSVTTEDQNLNIHTKYSFSPYTPTMAAYMAYRSGLTVAGICDGGNSRAYGEFSRCCRRLGVVPSLGTEFVAKSEWGIINVAIYGMDEEAASEFFEISRSFRAGRAEKARKATANIAKKFRKYGITLNYLTDVLPLSQYKRGGTVTSKHIFMAVADKLIQKYGKGRQIADLLRSSMCLDVSEIEYNMLLDANNPFYEYDLLAVLRRNSREFANDENLPDSEELIFKAKRCGAICAYYYQSDKSALELATESDKALAEFSALTDKISAAGFNAVSFSIKNMPDNFISGCIKIMRDKGLLSVLTEKVQYPRSRFESLGLPQDARDYFLKCAYAVVGNVTSVSLCRNDAMFSDKTMLKCPDFTERLNLFSQIGRKSL